MRTSELSPKDKYISSLYPAEDACLEAVKERLVSADRWGINIGSNEGRMLQLFMKMAGVSKAVEIGTLFGYSGVWIARALPAGGILHTIERDHDASRMAKKAFEECGVADRVKLHEGEAIDELEKLASEGPFDMVFIDANKTSYEEYLEWATKNVRKGGLIIADNTLLGGNVIPDEKPEALSNRQYSVMRSFNQKIADSSKYFSTIVPTAEGLTVAIRL
ncbi:MAG TPA: O-methyltransferase [Bdellovibrionales bacterium]|nr:O-methyltransferase [Bdellovibrionales bacterium]